MAKAVGLLPNGYCLFAKVRASLPDSTAQHRKTVLAGERLDPDIIGRDRIA